ncbi:MAG: hypothetical protein OEO79_14390 [Gemmatimonadota bacterium]|nr:hypothetical protein [Gemmatimonadota bacterium]
MSESGRRRAVVNFVTVVAGILAAFALDAGWETLQAAREEGRILEVLEEEFRANRAAAEDPLRRHAEYVDWSETFLSEVAASPARISADSLTTLLSRVAFGWTSYNPATGTTQALLTGGQIARLGDFELQRLLAGWPGSLADLAESESRTILTYDELSGFLSLESPVFFALERLDPSSVDAAVARDPRVAGLVLRRSIEEGEALSDTERVVRDIEAILARLSRLRER